MPVFQYYRLCFHSPMPPEIRTGTVVAVCMNPEHGYPTYPQESVIIGMLGIEGDAHSGELRESFTKPGTLKPNDRPISIVAEEVRNKLNADFGINMQHGDFNEQMVVEGLGDLGDIPIGSRIIFSSGVELEVTDHAMPCIILESHNNTTGLAKALVQKRDDGSVYSKRGKLAKVIRTGTLHPGHTITVTFADTE